MTQATPTTRPPSRLDGIRRGLADFTAPGNAFALSAAMTLLLYLRHSEKTWPLEIGVYALAVLGLLHRPLARQAAFWFLITAFMVVGHARLWFQIDNHKYLMTYWALAFGLSLLGPSPAESLRRNARLLVGIGFGLAVLAKLLSPDYLSGGFFESLLVSDARFRHVASFLGGIPIAELQMQDIARRDVMVYGDLTAPLTMPMTPRLALLAQGMMWWTLLIEAAVAVLFLWPEDRGPSRWRDAALLIFIATTYPVAPVIGFAWVLAAMGVAQASRPRYRLWALLYVAVFVFVMMSVFVPFAPAFGF